MQLFGYELWMKKLGKISRLSISDISSPQFVFTWTLTFLLTQDCSTVLWYLLYILLILLELKSFPSFIEHSTLNFITAVSVNSWKLLFCVINGFCIQILNFVLNWEYYDNVHRATSFDYDGLTIMTDSISLLPF